MSGVVDLGEQPSAKHPYRRRHARQTLTFLLLVAIVLGTGAVAFGVWTGAFSLGSDGRPSGAPCPTATQTAAPADSTRVRVYNGSGRRGLAASVARALQKRGFTVPVIDNAPAGTKVLGPVQLRYGPEGVLPARTLAAQFNGTPQLAPDPQIADDAVDLYLGPAFAEMRTVPEALKALTPPPAPSPSGCIAGDSTPRPLLTDPNPPRPAATTTP